MNVGIDIDGVLFPWVDVANETLVRRFEIDDPGPHISWRYLQRTVTPDQWAWLWSAEGQDAVFGQVDRVYPDVVPAFEALLRNPARRCHFVTHRDPRRTALHTATFLTRNFGSHPWAGMHVVQNGVRKCDLIEWDVFIDDKPATLLDMLAWTNAHVFAPARPWNEELEGLHSPRFTRYDDPWEIVEWVRS